MRLAGKQLLLLISDGVDQEEVELLRKGFEEENAVVSITSPAEYLTVESIYNGRRGKDIYIDIPFESVKSLYFDGLIIPDGLISNEKLAKNRQVLDLIKYFHLRKLPIFASGEAVQLLYESEVLSEQILVREGTPLTHFLDQAVAVLLDALPQARKYRAGK